jgi:hypothetical protein
MSEIKVNSIKGVGASAAAITVNNTDGTCTANITSIGSSQLSNRNKIINGSMICSQRGTSETGVNSSGYKNAPDRWTHQIASSQSAYTVSQSTDSPDGFANSYKIDVTTADTSLHADHVHFFRQKIEGQNLQDFAKGTSSAKQFALSFYVKTTKTGTYVLELYDVDNSRQISKTYTVSDTNWNRYTLIFPADTTGAFGNDNGNSFAVQFYLSAGANYTSGTLNSSAWASATQANRAVGQVNFDDSTSNDWYLTGVQLEVGSVATDFEHRSFGQELALCQRYCYVDRGSEDYHVVAQGHFSGSGTAMAMLYLPVCMRAAPTLSYPTGTWIFSADSGTIAQSNIFPQDNIGGVNAIHIRGAVSGAPSGEGFLLRTSSSGHSWILSAEL